MIDAVIFDVDGTLVDSVDDHAEAWRRSFAHFGFRFSFAAVRSQIGKGGDQLLPAMLSSDDIERHGKAIERYRKALFERDYVDSVPGFPQVRSLFDRLLGDGKRIALASSAKGDELQRYKKIAGVDDLDLIETSSDDAKRSKPHPDIFHAALEKLELRADVCVVVGDTPYDAEAARKAGLRVTGVLCGGFAEDDIRAAGASDIYKDLADILTHYEAWMAALNH